MVRAGLYCHWLVVCVRVQKLGVSGALRASKGRGGVTTPQRPLFCSDGERRCVICASSCFPEESNKMSNDWSNGLCSCFEDCSTCKQIINFVWLDYLKLAAHRCITILYFDVLKNFQASSPIFAHATFSERMPNSWVKVVSCTLSPSSSRC